MKRIKWHTLLLSLVYLALGVFLMIAPGTTLSVVCYLVGGTVLLCGVVQLVRYFMQKGTVWYAPVTLCCGILCLAVGGFLVLRSDIVISILPIMFGLFVVFDSISRIQNALELRRCGYRSWTTFLLLGLLSVALGALMVLNPFGTMETLVVAIGVILTMEGVLNLISSLYTSVAVWRFTRLHPVANAKAEEATGVDINGDGVVAAPVTPATVEGTVREVEGEADTEAVVESAAEPSAEPPQG